MKLVIALLFIFNGEIDHSKSMYFDSITNCRWYCQQVSKEQRYYEATECVCRLAWVDVETPTIR
jgi:hypothetical protein